MKHIVKTVSRFLLASLILGCGFFALQQNKQNWTANYAEEESPSVSQKTYTAADFADEVQADPEELDVSLIQSNTTGTSQSLNFAFKSKTLVVYTTAKNDFVVNITDSAFTGDANAPVGEEFDNFDEETNLPLLEGEIMYITGATVSRDGGDVTIPSTLTLDGTFIINVTAIASHCITADGAQYKGNNTWYDISGTELKFNKVYIPSSVKTIYSNAFTGVPDGVTVFYEGESLPAGFASDWIDKPTNVTLGQYGKESNRARKVGNKLDDVTDEHGRPVNFVLGCKQDGNKYVGEQYDRPLVVQFDKVTKSNGAETKRETIFEALPLSNTTGSAYDSVGRISALDYSRLLNYKLGPGEEIDDNSIIFHNIMKFGEGVNINTTQRYFAKPAIKYLEKVDLSRLVSFEASKNYTFAGYSMFSLTMDKNLSITSSKYEKPHSYYLDVKSDFYEQNRSKIEQGLTEIRYSLYNLYLSSYHFIYEGKDGLKDIVVPVSSAISYQILEKDAGNKVSIILKNKDVAEDFSADKVKTFELVNITIQMDLLTTSDSGSKSVLAKSQASYKFAYITVVDNQDIKVFNWNIFLLIFLVVYIAVYCAIAFVMYKIRKEKYKNDEFRRVNDKKYLKSAILYGFGGLVIAYAIIFILMRSVGFANTIVAFNPTDPLLIAFAIAGMIIGGYFIVLAIKSIKIEKERRKAIRLKLNEDVEDDGTK